ncbi:MAG: cysteine dioxygenase family protein [Rhodospirillales bacterium]|nr:cysteine dioxygenase family protein [Rhodospirillales bacterium]
MYTFDEYVGDLRRITAATTDYAEIFDQVSPLASKISLAKDGWMKPELYETDEEQGFGAHLLHEEDDHSLAVFAVAWAPQNGTPPHDHGTWAIVAGVDGTERNIKYNRLDDRSKPDYAELEERCSFTASAGEVICLKPKGIHLVWNDNDVVTVSLHTYGRHFNHTGRSSFNTETNEVIPFVVSVK